MILSLALRRLAEAYGVGRTIVIAGVAGRAVSQPLRSRVLDDDIVQRADLRAQTAAGARVSGVPRPVGNEETVEKRPDGIGIQPRHAALEHLVGLRTVPNQGGDPGQLSARPVDLGAGKLGSVELHAHDVDIGLGHHEADRGVEPQPDLHKSLSEDFHGVTRAVAVGQSEPAVARLSPKRQPADEVQHQTGRSPAVHRTYEAEPFAFLQGPAIPSLAGGLGNEHEILSERL